MSVKRAIYSGLDGTISGRSLRAWAPTAIGGTITTSGGYRIHTFSSVGSGTFDVLANLSLVEYLIVAAGGTTQPNQGSNREAGAGAGGYLTGTISVSSTTYSLSVGNRITTSGNGQNSTGFGLTSYGGGRGGNYDGTTGTSGGSGGGNWYSLATPASGTAGQGNRGGPVGGANNYTGGGGGGAGAVGNVGTGGAGVSNSISGSSYTYSTGGASNTFGSTPVNANGVNYGDGSSGAAYGRQGVIIIRYPDA